MIFKLLFYGLIFYVIYRFVKKLGSSGAKSADGTTETTGSSTETTELIQDPQCGTYFLRQRGVEARIDGKVVHFCSKTCRDTYIEKRRTG